MLGRAQRIVPTLIRHQFQVLRTLIVLIWHSLCAPPPWLTAPTRRSRAAHAPLTRRSRAAHTPLTRRSHAAHAPLTRRSRAAHAPLARRSRAAHTPLTRRSRAAREAARSTPLARRSRAAHTPLARQRGAHLYPADLDSARPAPVRCGSPVVWLLAAAGAISIEQEHVGYVCSDLLAKHLLLFMYAQKVNI
jgi:hypothetical protein